MFSDFQSSRFLVSHSALSSTVKRRPLPWDPGTASELAILTGEKTSRARDFLRETAAFREIKVFRRVDVRNKLVICSVHLNLAHQSERAAVVVSYWVHAD